MARNSRGEVNVLSVNGGSSSLKLWVYAMPEERRVASATVNIADQASELAGFIDTLERDGMGIDAVGHRIVFGGASHTTPELVTPQLLEQMQELIPYDALHLQPELDAVVIAQRHVPNVPHVLCYDTAFCSRMPRIAKTYPLGDEFGGVSRFGFHGLSCEYIVSVLGASGKTVIAHLGNGASATAVLDGHPIDTTMGFSPLGGLMMGTRPGDLDPGVLLYAASELGYDNATLRKLITDRSGLLGVSGSSPDMRTLLARRATDERAALAVDLFVYIARKQIGALAAVLGGIDTLVFTGGIGENSGEIRNGVAEGLRYLGDIDVRTIPTDEALSISRHVHALLSARTART
ncbi:MAG: acetate kinase [Candidatus Eremiobacteraeota bacterium]|nr:acetate kinase [Candidatus Eremiobacteraeota bacterium]